MQDRCFGPKLEQHGCTFLKKTLTINKPLISLAVDKTSEPQQEACLALGVLIGALHKDGQHKKADQIAQLLHSWSIKHGDHHGKMALIKQNLQDIGLGRKKRDIHVEHPDHGYLPLEEFDNTLNEYKTPPAYTNVILLEALGIVNTPSYEWLFCV